ncbi:hypothetical protein ACOYR1_15145 [Thalassotalea piscium]
MTQKIKVRLTHGCIEVKNIEDALALIEEILNAHPSIECDWVDGALIED